MNFMIQVALVNASGHDMRAAAQLTPRVARDFT